MKKLLLTTIIALLTAVCAMGQRYDFAAQSGTNTLFYKITDAENKEVALVSEFEPLENDLKAYNTEPKGTLIIPSSVTNGGITYSVTSIGDKAFFWCFDLTGPLTIPNSVAIIGAGAFNNCSDLTGSLTIPSSVTNIEREAFLSCRGLTGSLIIPNSVTTIEARAFEDCSGFTGSLIIPNSLTTIANRAFWGCKGLSGSLVIPNSVTTIGYYAFEDCSGFTGSLIIPNSVTSIGVGAFEDCSGFTGSLIIPNSLTTIGKEAFDKCTSLTEVINYATVPQDIEYLKVFLNVGIDTIILYVPEASIEAYKAAEGWKDFKNIESATSFTAITAEGYELAYDINFADTTVICLGLKNSADAGSANLVIPSTATHLGVSYRVTSIKQQAFYCCNGFTGTLTIPSSIDSIGSKAFSTCSGFTGELTIPNGVTSIGDMAFYGCTNFTGDLTIPNGVTNIGGYAFAGYKNNPMSFTGALTIGHSLENINEGAFQFCSGFSKVANKATVPQEIDGKAFNGVGIDTITLYVQEASIEDYKTAPIWQDFKTIETIEDMKTSIDLQPKAEDVFVKQGSVLVFKQKQQVYVFNISGQIIFAGKTQQLELPTAGVYVVQTANGNYKIIN